MQERQSRQEYSPGICTPDDKLKNLIGAFDTYPPTSGELKVQFCEYKSQLDDLLL